MTGSPVVSFDGEELAEDLDFIYQCEADRSENKIVFTKSKESKLPNFKVSDLVKKPKNANDKPRKIGSKTARAMLNWRHYEFRQYLASRVLMRGNGLEPRLADQ